MYRVMRVLAANLKPKQLQLFLESVVLETAREDIRENGRMHPLYRRTLEKSMFKPAAFFQGFLFPLLNVSHWSSIPVVPSDRAALSVKLHIERGEYCSRNPRPKTNPKPSLCRRSFDHQRVGLLRYVSATRSWKAKLTVSAGPHSLFIRVLLNKKHALPYKTLDDLFNHFVRLANTYKPASKGEPSKLPVMWHQSLLVYCQRYSSDLTQDQKNALLDVVRIIGHFQIGPEIRRELISSVARGEPRPPEQDDAMQL